MQFNFFDIFGRPQSGYLALPASPGEHPAIVVVHEWWGVNDQIRSICDRFAKEGFMALAVDLYGGQVTTDAGEAAALSQQLVTSDALGIIVGAVDGLSEHTSCNGNVGVTGFCLGGAIALAAAANVPGLRAAVPFYGTPKDEFCQWNRVECSVLGHFARRDTYIPVSRVSKIEADMKAAGVDVRFEWYNADHAFMRETDPSVYDPESAELAWRRTTDFLRTQLG